MVVNIVGRHMDLADEDKLHAEEEARKLGKFFNGVNDIQVTFEREGNAVKSEIICMVSGGRTLVANERGETVHQSLEFASENMARQIKRYKGKLHRRRAGREAPEEPTADEAEST